MLAGGIDAIAPVITMLYLICYLFVNLSTALLSLLRYPNWRPTWRYYHWSLSLFGAVLCLVYMFLSRSKDLLLYYSFHYESHFFIVNYIFALIALLLVACMYSISNKDGVIFTHGA